MKPLGQAIMSYLEVLQAKGAVLVEGGIDGAIPVIAKEITNSEDMSGTAALLILSFQFYRNYLILSIETCS
jgi:hypothetical protein